MLYKYTKSFWKKGVRLGEDTALLIENGKNAVCKGSGMTIVLNPHAIRNTNCGSVEKGCPIFVDHIMMTILTDGCRISLSTGQFENARETENSTERD
ncbi:hypothetical protein [uncultured Chryseobacterium sp.]|uniref:hypothetical protein n=1 Tax=uncultured Chryseobacterium sp. TaxID=259322 RepID=UPI0025F17DFE|nr:hypothetical protein [uncultured Chryseobacterium sp.]